MVFGSGGGGAATLHGEPGWPAAIFALDANACWAAVRFEVGAVLVGAGDDVAAGLVGPAICTGPTKALLPELPEEPLLDEPVA
jgi:hypothetical protein